MKKQKGSGAFEFVIVLLMVVSALAYSLGFNIGKREGREDVFKGAVLCQKLPDDTIYCYKSKESENTK